MKHCLKEIWMFSLLIAVIQVSASDNKNLVIQNQYNAKLKSAAVNTSSDTTTFFTNDRGEVSLQVKPTDSLTIVCKDYDTAKIAASKISASNIIEVKKPFSWKDLLTPMFYIINGGLWFLLFVVFAETGLFAGFFLPGDSLLFVAGIYSVEIINNSFPFIGNEYMQLVMLWILISAAGIVGNMLGYWFGKKVGTTMYGWKDNFLFKQKYLTQAHDFYERQGGGAIVIARFLPIIRTFAPIVAGIVGMDKKKFTYYNIVGCIAWVFSMLVAGHFLQKWILHQFNFDLREHLEVIVIGIVLVTTAPVIFKLAFGKKK
jgi:membrane-associated protein